MTVMRTIFPQKLSIAVIQTEFEITGGGWFYWFGVIIRRANAATPETFIGLKTKNITLLSFSFTTAEMLIRFQ